MIHVLHGSWVHLWVSLAHSRGEGHSDEDPAQGVVFSVHGDGRTNLQITE